MNRFLSLLFTGWLLFSSVAVGGEQPIAILLSDSVRAYEDTADLFESSVETPIVRFNLQGDIRKDPDLKMRLFDAKPRLILALGAKAAFVAKFWTREQQDIPVVFAMVLNWSKYNLLSGQTNVTGIASETAPGNQFTSLALFAPNIKRIGVIYSKKQSKQIIDDAKEVAKDLGYELLTQEISEPNELQGAFRQLSRRVDAFWILNDPVTYTVENMAWMNRYCIQYQIICIGQSENAARLGLMLSVSPDPKNIGLQAAGLARSILNGKNPETFGAMPPIANEILVNIKTARKIGLTISQSALDIATEVIE